jgi:hypothetical protein
MFADRWKCVALPLSLWAGGAAWADPGAHLADIGVRIAYGFYAEEPAVIEAARRDLEKLPAADPRVNYYHGLAAWRAAQLDASQRRPVGPALAACIDSAALAAEQRPASAEPWILVAACSALGVRTEPAKALFHGRRFEQATMRARAFDAANPRLALVEASRAVGDPARFERAAGAALTAPLEAAIDAFRARPAKLAEADWGEAEALALLGAVYLHHGEVRAARDAIEQALLAAPGYEYALQLRRKIQTVR